MLSAKKVVQVCLIAFVVNFGIVVPAVAQDVFDAVPADAMFAVRINNFEYTLGQLDQFLASLAPTPNSASMMGRMQLANLLGDPNLTGVNLQGQMAVFGTAVQKEPNAIPKMFVAGIIPVTNYKAFITSNHSATKLDANGIGTIGQMKLLVAQDVNFAILASPNDYAALVNAIKMAKAKSLSAALPAAQRKATAKARIWANGNVEQAMKLYGPTIFAKMEEVKNTMPAKDPNMAAMAKVMTMYFDIIKSVMSQTQSITLAVNPSPAALGLTNTITAIPGTDMANAMAPAPAVKGSNILLGWLQDGAFMNMDAKIDKLSLITMYDKFIDILAPMFGPKFTAEEKAKMLARIHDTVNSLGDEIACSAAMDPNSTPPFNLSYIFEVSDVAAFQKGVDAKIETLNVPYMKDFLKNFGIKLGCELKRDAQKYNGVAVDTVNVTIDPIDPNNKMGQVITKMYGQGLTGRMAIINGLAIYIAGANADSRIKTMIDTAKAGGPKKIAGEIKTAMALVPDSNQAEFFGTYNYLRILQAMAGFMPNMPIDANSLRQIASKSNIVFDGGCGTDSATVNLVIPKEHVLEIKSAFETIMPKQGRPCN